MCRLLFRWVLSIVEIRVEGVVCALIVYDGRVDVGIAVVITQGAALHTVCLLCHESLVQQMQEVGRWYQMRLLQGKKL